MSRRRILTRITNSCAARHAAAPRYAPARSPPRRGGGAFGTPKAERTAIPWPCLLSSIAVGVTPLRNLTGDTDQQNLLDAFASDLAADLTRHGRGFLLRSLANFAEGPESDVKYLVTGSAQRGSPGVLRINVRITDASTFEYLWARRFEFDADETVLMQAKIIRRISRELHILLL